MLSSSPFQTAARDQRLAMHRAKRLLRQRDAGRDQILAAAMALEACGLDDAAVAMLIARGMEEQAALMLQRKRRMREAAKLYSSMGNWLRAGECFRLAGMDLEAARCAYRARDFVTAAALFRAEGHLEMAAKSAARAGDHREAALLFGRRGDFDAARSHYAAWLAIAPADVKLTREERLIVRAVVASAAKDGPLATRLMRLDGGGDQPLTSPRTVIEEYLPPSEPSLRNTFADSNFLQSFTPAERDLLWRLGDIQYYQSGQVIVDQHEQPPGTFTLLAGNVTLFKGAPGALAPVDSLAERSTIGQAWSLLDLRSAVRAVAATSCGLHVINRRKVHDFVAHQGTTGANLHRRISDALLTHLVQAVANFSPRGAR